MTTQTSKDAGRFKLEAMEFLTSAEVAAKLKLNQQVVVRKLQAGEIPGYKLGKDWRIAQHELWEWLQGHSNKQRPTPRSKVEKIFFVDGRLKEIPAQRKKRTYVLERLLELFEHNRVYLEAEVDSILRAYHSDVSTLRREMICEHMMVRSNGKYKRATAYRRID